MGNFMGHAVPGTFFFLFGLWWTFACLRRYFACRKSGRRYISTPIFGLAIFSEVPSPMVPDDGARGRCKAFCGRLPVEAVVKMVFSAIGMTIEIGAHLPPPLPGRIVQHTTMYAFFLIAGLVDTACHLGLPLPAGSQHAIMALALSVEGLLFASHVHGRDMLDIHIHMLLVYVIGFSVIALLAEVRFNKSPLLTLTRAFLFMLQGTWFWAVAVILYKHGVGHSEWDLNSHSSVMLSTIYFCWHMAAIFFVILVMAMVMGRYYLGSLRDPAGPPPSSDYSAAVSLSDLKGRVKSDDSSVALLEDCEDAEGGIEGR